MIREVSGYRDGRQRQLTDRNGRRQLKNQIGNQTRTLNTKTIHTLIEKYFLELMSNRVIFFITM